MFSSWGLFLVADDKLGCFSFPQDSPLSVSLPQHALSITEPKTPQLSWEQRWGTEALTLCRVTLCAPGSSSLSWHPTTKSRIHLIRCRNLL